MSNRALEESAKKFFYRLFEDVAKNREAIGALELIFDKGQLSWFGIKRKCVSA
jgi:hypothetical protein